MAVLFEDEDDFRVASADRLGRGQIKGIVDTATCRSVPGCGMQPGAAAPPSESKCASPVAAPSIGVPGHAKAHIVKV